MKIPPKEFHPANVPPKESLTFNPKKIFEVIALIKLIEGFSWVFQIFLCWFVRRQNFKSLSRDLLIPANWISKGGSFFELNFLWVEFSLRGIFGTKFWISNVKLWISKVMLWISKMKLWISKVKLWISKVKL